MSLTREQLLAVQDHKTTEVQTPEWGEGASVFVRSLTGAERDELEAENSAEAKDAEKEDRKPRDLRARFCAWFICDAEGAPLFTLKDIDALTGKSGAVLSRILAKALELNAMREKDLKDLEKN